MFLFVCFVEISTILIRDGKKKNFSNLCEWILEAWAKPPSDNIMHRAHFKKAAYIQVFKWKL